MRKFSSKQFGLAIVAAVAIANTAMTASAATLGYEGFTSYTAGNAGLIGQSAGGIGWNGAWQSGQSDGFLRTVRTPTAISYPGYTGSTTPAASGGNFLNLAAGFGGANPNGVFRPLDVSIGGTFGAAGLVSDGTIGNDNTVLWASILLSANSAGGTASVSFSTANTNNSVNLTPLQTQTSNLVIFRFNFGAGATDTLTVFSNPNLATFDGTTGGTTSAAGDFSFTTFGLTAGLSSGGGAEAQYDDIRFGTTLADVAPIPEPTSIAALAIISGMILRRRQQA